MCQAQLSLNLANFLSGTYDDCTRSMEKVPDHYQLIRSSKHKALYLKPPAETFVFSLLLILTAALFDLFRPGFFPTVYDAFLGKQGQHVDFSHFWGVALKDKRNFRESEINGKCVEMFPMLFQ